MEVCGELALEEATDLRDDDDDDGGGGDDDDIDDNDNEFTCKRG
jgi:hypothetical protein